MPSLGPAEILVILVVALLVFGPDKMPEMARQAGRAFREFRRVQQHLRSEISGAMGDVAPAPDTAAESGVSDAASSGDPVPMLPPKADTEVRQPDAQPPPGATGGAPGAGPPEATAAPPPAADDPGADGPAAPADPA